MSKFKLSYYTIITDLLDETAENPKRIIYSTRSGRALTISDAIVQKVQNNDFAKIPGDTLFQLIEMEFIVDANENEFLETLSQNKVAEKDSKVLGITMQAGANCQLGCHYCGQVHVKHNISESLYESLINRVRHNLGNKSYEGLYVTWYGGEPLTAYKQIRELTHKFKELATQKDIFYEAGMITNGLSLKQNIYEELVLKYDLKYFQITIDGTKEHHDKRRITKKGEETYDIIFKNILDITSSKVFSEKKTTINIRINIDSTNYESVIPFLNILDSHKLQDKIVIQFAPISDWGGNKAGEASLSMEDFAVIEIDWLIHAIKLGFNFNLIPERAHSMCMVTDKDQEVYDAYGNIYPCWEFPYTPTYSKGNALIGNVTKPYDTYNEHATTRDWWDEVAEGNTWCLKCKFFPVCGGSCPKSWHEGTPPCPPFKSNMEDRLVMQYMMDKNKFKEVF